MRIYFLYSSFLGWLNIYSSTVPTTGVETSIFDTTQYYGKQMIFIALSFPIIMLILFTDAKFYEKYASVIFIVSLLSLAGLFVIGKQLQDNVVGMELEVLHYSLLNLQKQLLL